MRADFTVLDDRSLISAVAEALAAGKTVGWFQGRMEFGPRALGARSILADPRRADMQSTLNLKIKYRESFRPFAPAVLREEAANWFDLAQDSPFMSLVVGVRSAKAGEASQDSGLARLGLIDSDLPAVTHVDGSARVQTVDAATNPRFHRLISAFRDRTGCPVLVNTSFNVRGEPIVCTPEDAFRCFMKTGLDVLAIENCVLYKDSQDRAFATRTLTAR